MTEPTDEQLRDRIAKACGKHQYYGVIGLGYRCTDCGDYYQAEKHAIPDYPRNLNAMAAAEATLTDEQWERYECELWRIVAPGEIVQPAMPIRFRRAFLAASPRQRALAFVRTVEGTDK